MLGHARDMAGTDQEQLKCISEKRGDDDIERDLRVFSLANSSPAIFPSLDQNSPDRKIAVIIPSIPMSLLSTIHPKENEITYRRNDGT